VKNRNHLKKRGETEKPIESEKITTNNMNNLALFAQAIVALSIVIVWVFRFDNIIKEFKQYGLSDLTRTMVGSAKISLATLLVAGIWYPSLVLIPALLMAFLMISAQYFHFKVKNPLQKRMPSLLLLLLCLFIAAVSLNLIV
jgi:fatty acid desaturase